MAQQFSYEEARFKPKQREGAIMLVEYEFTPKAARKSKQEIADELGITRKTLHNWDTKDSNFIAYKNHLAAQYTDSQLAFVYQKLIESIGRNSVRAMELYMKRIGDLDTKTEVTVKQDGEDKTHEERKAAILERLRQQQED